MIYLSHRYMVGRSHKSRLASVRNISYQLPDSNRIGALSAIFEVKDYRCAMNQGLEATFSALIGKRVTIRLHEPEDGFRDIVGHLESPITLRNRHGKLIEFSYDEIALWKEVVEKK